MYPYNILYNIIHKKSPHFVNNFVILVCGWPMWTCFVFHQWASMLEVVPFFNLCNTYSIFTKSMLIELSGWFRFGYFQSFHKIECINVQVILSFHKQRVYKSATSLPHSFKGWLPAIDAVTGSKNSCMCRKASYIPPPLPKHTFLALFTSEGKKEVRYFLNRPHT